MSQYRNISPQEIAAVEALGTSAESWSDVMVCDDFVPTQLVQSRLEGAIWIDSGARIVRSTVRNYRIGAGSLIEGGNGTRMPARVLVRQWGRGGDDQRERWAQCAYL